MAEQDCIDEAGVKQIKLYKAKGIEFEYNGTYDTVVGIGTITTIRTFAQAIDSSAIVKAGADIEHEADTFNYESSPVVFISRDFTDSTIKTAQGKLKTTRQLSIIFVAPDSWDNRGSDDDSEQTEESSIEIVLRLKTFANSVFWRFLETSDTVLTNNEQINFATTPIYRSTSNSYTGAPDRDWETPKHRICKCF